MSMEDRALEVAKQLTVEELCGLCSGKDCWHTKEVDHLGLPSIMVTDGPHGLRKQENSQDNFGIGESVPATCFPTASLSACSFDPELIYRMGQALGEECRAQDVAVLLGPGVNMKRSPLCGRNFEYFSEDPYLSGKMAAGFIRGVQSKGIGTSLKHFAVNNQERRRMSVSAVVDERTLRELYLKSFEIAVKEGKPWTVMCSYNRINGCYSSENEKLLKHILREQWGYDGAVVSDWGAVHLRTEGVKAGLDLEMPGNGGVNDKKLMEAMYNGSLTEVEVNEAATNVVRLILKSVMAKYEAEQNGESRPASSHHQMAVEVAQESMVLLKNDKGLLPITDVKDKSIAVVGRFAQNPRYQGAGSSKIHPIQIDSPFEIMEKRGWKAEYTEGSDLEETTRVCKDKNLVIVFVGLTERYESEGFDRSSMDMPKEHIELLKTVTKANDNVVVVLMGGAPMELPKEAEEAGAILLAYLGGEGVGTAVVNLLDGTVCPSGKLAETWPMRNEDCLSFPYFPGDRCNVEYREGPFVGYRYFDTVNKPVRFSFGHGLSYTSFAYRDLHAERAESEEGNKWSVRFFVKNTGNVAGKETAFVFASRPESTLVRPKRELIGFHKVALIPGEEKEIVIPVEEQYLRVYNQATDSFITESGPCLLEVGGSLKGLELSTVIEFNGSEQEEKQIEALARKISADSCYRKLASGQDVSEIPDHDFEQWLGFKRPEPATKAVRPFTMDNCLEDVQDTFLGGLIVKIARKFMGKVSATEEDQDQMMDAAMMEMPFFSLWVSSGGMIPEWLMKGIIKAINFHLPF